MLSNPEGIFNKNRETKHCSEKQYRDAVKVDT